MISLLLICGFFFPITQQSGFLLRKTVKIDGDPECLASNKSHIFMGSRTGDLYIYSLQEQIVTKKEKYHTRNIEDIVVTEDNSKLISASIDNYIHISSLPNLNRIQSLYSSYDFLKLALYPGDRYFAAYRSDYYIRIYDMEENYTWIQRQYARGSYIGGQNFHPGLQFSKEGRFLMSLFPQHKIQLWNTGDLSSLREQSVQFQYNYITCMQISYDSKQVYVGSVHSSSSYYGYIDIYNYNYLNGDTEYVKSLGPHNDIVTSIQISINGYLITASKDSELKLWDKQYSLIDSIKAHSQTLYMAKFNNDQTNVYTISIDSTLKIWELIIQNSDNDEEVEGNSVEEVEDNNAEEVEDNSVEEEEVEYNIEDNNNLDKNSPTNSIYQTKSLRGNNNMCLKISQITQNSIPTDIDGTDELQITIEYNNVIYETDVMSLGTIDLNENNNQKDIHFQFPCIEGETLKLTLTEWDICNNDYQIQYFICQQQNSSRFEFSLTPENTVITKTYCDAISDGSSHCSEIGANGDSEGLDLGIGYQYCRNFEEGKEKCVEISQGENDSTVSILYEIVEENNCDHQYSISDEYVGTFGPQFQGDICLGTGGDSSGRMLISLLGILIQITLLIYI